MIDILRKVHEEFWDVDESGYFMSGGCYDYAYGLGTALEDLGLSVEYYGYGSKEEPYVHVAIKALGYYIDFNTMAKDLAELTANADIYADTELTWQKVSKKSIPWKEDLTDRFLDLVEEKLDTN